MSRLLHMELTRLMRSLVFWLFVVMSFLLGAISVLVVYSNYGDMTGFFKRGMGEAFFLVGMLIIVLSVIFIALYLGGNHEKTMRNKIVVGYSKTDIYFSLLITVFIALAVFMIVCSLAVFAIGYPLACLVKGRYGGYKFIWRKISLSEEEALFTSAIIFLEIAFASIYTAIIMKARNKGVATIAALVGTVLFLIVAVYFYSEIGSLSCSLPAGMSQERGEIILWILKRLQNILPTGQLITLIMGNENHVLSWECCPFSVLIAVIAIVLGLRSFRKKDIK